MRITGAYTFDAPREVIYEMLRDPDVLSKAISGSTSLTRIGPDTYEARMTVKIGSIGGSYDGTVSVKDARTPEHFRLVVEGKGVTGFLKGEGTIDLSPVPTGTLIEYAGEANVGGRIAQVGQRLVESVARTLINAGLKSLEAQVPEYTSQGSDGESAIPEAEETPLDTGA